MAQQLQYHVNGEASIWSGTAFGQTLEQLGVSVEGVEISINNYYEDVKVDTYGPHVPGDVQYFLQDAIIKCQLVWYDLTVLNKWLTAIPGAGLTTGTLGAAGNLVLQNALTARLLIRSTPSGTGLTTVEPCWNFPHAFLIDAAEQKIGTVKTIWNLTWRALPAYQSSSSLGAVLWNTTCV